MQVSELNGKETEQNDKLLSDFAVTRRQSRSLYRNWAIISKRGNSWQSHGNVFSKISTTCLETNPVLRRESSDSIIEERADEIVRHIEKSQSLMGDNPKSTNDRIETLREMTEYLTLKRTVKRKLVKSIGSTNKTLSFHKRLKYRLSIILFKVPITIKHFLNNFELWYSSLKVIEGHFGSSVASYFKFLRQLFILNSCIFTLSFFFVMIPQLLVRFIEFEYEYSNYTFASGNLSWPNPEFEFVDNKPKSAPLMSLKANPYEENSDFRLGNVFTGEGFLTSTILFYGYYSNMSITLIEGYSYNIPAAYFLTSAMCYFILFLFLFISVAVSYRKCYIEASGGMKNTFTNKILCGWDFGIATKQAAELKSMSIFIEIKELLDGISKPTKRKTCLSNFYTTAISFSLNGLILFILGIGGMYSWKYLDQQMYNADTATTMMMWLILTLVVAIAPVLFSLIAHLEGFESPSSALYMTLIRAFTLYAVVIAVVVAYRLNRSGDYECWETILGQDMFRLVVLDFIFGSLGTTVSEFIRYRIFTKMWKGMGCPEFDIARNTMNLIYNQTLFYVGFYFSPLLSLVIAMKLFVTFYLKKWGAIYNCKPFVKPWKASQAQTVYLSIAFFAYFCVLIAHGYIITSVKTSNCGPFSGQKYTYETLLKDVFANNNSSILVGFYYLTRPGVVGIILMAMVLGVYYMRAVALARIHVVKHLQHLLRLKAEDRKLLLQEISKYTKDRNSFSDSSPFGDLRKNSFRSNSLKRSRPKTGSVKTKNTNEKAPEESLSNPRTVFLPLNDVYSANDLNVKNECDIFSRCQNVSDLLDQELEMENKSRRKGSLQNHIYEMPQTSNSCIEENFERKNFSSSGTYCILSEASDSELTSNKGLQSHSEGSSRLNFNPVFTQSASVYYDGEKNDGDIYETPVSDRLQVPCEKDCAIVNQRQALSPQSDCSGDICKFERVPSRISFDFDVKKSKTKKLQ